MKNLIFIAFLVISGSLFGQINVTVTGSWIIPIGESDISTIGNDYPAAFTSTDNQTTLFLDPKNKNKSIYVYVTRSDIAWHNNLTLKIRHTSTNINIIGGSSFTTITNSQSPVTPLFNWKGDFITIPLQYEITGISVLLPVASYSTIITYTVIQP